MRYYLAPFVGTGTDDAPFRPPTAQPFTLLDLRADVTQRAGWCLLAVPVAEAIPGAVEISDALDRNIPGGIRTALRQRLGIDVSARTVRELVFELLIEKPDLLGIPPIRPGRDGRKRIYLGGEVVVEEP